MFLVKSAMVDIGVADAAVAAILGYAVVFFGLILLMFVVMALGKAMTKAAKKKAAAPAEEKTPVSAMKSDEPAPGTAGEVKTFDVPDREAAMIMAIVAEKAGRSLNELRFKSIKEVK